MASRSFWVWLSCLGWREFGTCIWNDTAFSIGFLLHKHRSHPLFFLNVFSRCKICNSHPFCQPWRWLSFREILWTQSLCQLIISWPAHRSINVFVQNNVLVDSGTEFDLKGGSPVVQPWFVVGVLFDGTSERDASSVRRRRWQIHQGSCGRA